MNLPALNQTLQFIAWFLALVEVIVGLYVLVLNNRHTANRHLSALLLIIAINSYAVGAMSAAGNLQQAIFPVRIIAGTSPAILPLLLMTTIALLRPQWLSNRRRWLFLPFYLLVITPFILTLVDAQFGTRLWYTGISPQAYTGGFLQLAPFTSGDTAQLLHAIFFIALPLMLILFLVYFAIFDKKATSQNKKLARMLLIAEITSVILLSAFSQILYPAVTILLSSTISVIIYTFAAFRQMISESRLQRGSLQTRLTAIILVTVVPTLLGLVLFMTTRVQNLMEQEAISGLYTVSRTLSSTTSLWLDLNTRVLRELAAQPDITSMNPEKQKTVLEAMAAEYPGMDSISTTDMNGKNIARSDGAALKDYSDHPWFQEVAQGESLVLQTMLDPYSGDPALVVSVPIFARGDQFAGVLMFTANLEAIAEQVNLSNFEDRQMVYIVDEQNRVVIHSNPQYTSNLIDLSHSPPVAALRQGNSDPISFSDESRTRWRAVGNVMENGWAVIAQVPEEQLNLPIRTFQQVSWIALGLGVALLILMSWLAIRQTIHPIRALTETATAIAVGDLTRVAPVETEDEVGLLARTFNSMTSQIRDLVTGLERRVSERTRDLEKRAVQLQVTADVAREAAAIRDLERLLDHTVYLISKRFSFYHAGIFLVDEAKEYAVLRAASSEGGRRMLAREHKLKIGQVGIVGYTADKGEPRIALDVGADAVYFDNPDLPQTRSEMALPLMVREEAIGVLDVQSTKASAFSEEDIAILQILADQIALAIDNTRLLQESQQALAELENLYYMQVGRAWQQRLTRKPAGFLYDRLGVKPLDTTEGEADSRPSTNASSNSEYQPAHIQEDAFSLRLPITLRGQVLGNIILKREEGQAAWTPGEIETVSSIITQLGLALENARLLDEIRQRAQNEQVVGNIASRVQSSLDIETVMKRTVEEIGQAFRANKVRIQLGNGDSHGNQESSLSEA